jgi:nucleotide-binding universal stress UspA family protein
MVIPPKFLEIESMGVLYDGSAETENALELAVLLSHKAAWPLTILVPSQDNQQIGVLNRQLDEYFEMHDDFPVDWDTVALTELKDETVLQFIRDGSIELLVLAAAAQPPIRLLRESPIPLILTC